MDAAALLCNICPKHPRFSDVSHLLTHVSSKAHLSHYFKLQVRSHQEPQAEIMLDEYNRWYKANNLAKLLSDRMSSKESRKRKSLGKSAIYNRGSDTIKNEDHKRIPPTSAYPYQHGLPDYIDPRLSDPFSSLVSETSKKADSFSSFNPLAPTSSSDTTFRQRMEYTQTPMASPCSAPTVPLSIHWKQEGGYDTEEECSVIPHQPRTFKDISGMDALTLNDHFHYDPFIDDNDTYYSNNSEVDKERADEIARLKGVLWPGMDIFDSATEQMRRKRNQKKDESILKMMEKTSLCVEPTELVFSPTGILRKQRVISGNVDDSSPLKGETPIPKRRATRPKRVLSQADSNPQRGPGRKRAGRCARRERNTLEDDFDQKHYSFRSSLTDPPVGYGNYAPKGDEVDEFTLSLTGQELKPGGKIPVFHDTSNLHKLKVEDDLRVDKMLREESVASQPLPFGCGAATINKDYNSTHSINYASSFAKKDSYIAAGKENIEPLLNVYGRIDPLVGWHSPAMKRHSITDVGLPPQFFFRDVPHFSASPFEGQDSLAGYSYNPLATSFSKKTSEDNPIYAAESSEIFKTHPAACSNSPEATISDVEDNDFERLYLDGSTY